EMDEKGDLTIRLADNATFESLTTGNTVMNSDGLTIKDGPKFTKDSIDVAGNTISNVADGQLDSDAVNLSQLKAGTKYFNANSTGEDSQALGLDAVAIGMGAIAHNANDVALGAGSETAAAAGTAGVSINGTDYAFAGANPTSTLSVGSEGAERTITNVAAGRLSETSTDAVNGSQLFATNTAIDTLADTPLTFAANQGDNAERKLGETMRILGGGATENGETYSAGNVLTEMDEKGDLTIRLADNATFESLTTGNTVMNTDGLTIKDGPKFTKDSIDVAGNTISNVADGQLDSDAVNLSQLKAGTKYFNANSTGEDSQALGLDAVAIGMGAIAHNANDVALGAGSETAAAAGTAGVSINGTDYAFAGANPTSTLSVGSEGAERTITNVAAGRLSETSTDAVNGSQLFATNTALENLDNSVGGLQNDALLWDADKGAFSASHGDTTVNKITNVAAGELSEQSTDAVNGSQLFATNQNVETNTTNIAQNTQNISNLGDTVENIYTTGTKYFHANSTGADSQALGQDSVAIGMGAVANNANDVALGANAVTDAAVGTAGVSINGTDYAFAGANPTSTVSVGSEGAERTITNVAAGRLSETSTDAVNGSQLFATNTALENLDNSVGGLQDDALLWDESKGAFSASHGDTTVNKITNVAAGELSEQSTDAVNGSQLFATNQQVETNTTNIAQNTQNISNLGDTVENIYTTGTKYFHANSTGADSQALGLDSVAIGMGAIAHNANDVALGAGSETAAAAGTAGVSINGTDYAFAGANPTSTVSVGSEGAERTITNVAAGRLSETSTDAVNGSQLFATNTALENLDNSVGGLQNDALLWDADKGAFSASHGNTTVNKITNVAAGELSEQSTDAVNGSQLFATNQQVETNTTNINNLGDTVENIYNTGIKYFHANSTGADSQALGLDSVAIGMGAIANNANDVALGANAVTEAAVGTAGVTLRGTDYAFAGANPTSTVSVGSEGAERTITNVAAGRLSETSTDAVNGSQLYATNSAVENLHTSVGGLEQDALLWDADKGAFSASHGSTTVNKITNVAAGELSEQSTDAVNGSQLFATNQNVETNTTNIAQNTQNISNLGDTVENIYNTGIKYFHANSTGADSQALGLDSVAIGMGAVANNAGDIALGAGSLTEAAVGTAGVTLRGTDYAFAGANPTSTLSVGSEGAERTITNVAAGRLSETSTDAVNGSQLYATNTAVENLNIDVDGLQKDALLWDEYVGSFSASHGDTTVNKITNVAAGELSEQSTDAVNGSQLFATNQQVATNTTNIAQNTQNISNLGDTVENIYTTGTKYFHANSTGADSQALGLDSVAIGMGAVANNAGDIALGAGSLTEAAVGTAGVTLRGTDYAFAGANPTSTLSVGSEGAERTITNVAAGRLSGTSTDAVNGSQLYATNTALENIVINVDGLKDDALLWDADKGAFSASHGSSVVNKITNVAAGELSDKSTDAVNGSQLYATNQKVDNLDYRVTNIEENYTNTVLPTMRYLKVNSTGPDAVASGTDAIALGQGTVASGNNSIATGNGAQASGNGAIATGNNASASGTGSVAIGDNASVTASNSVALGSGSVADRDNTVSVGSAGNERQVTNVAAGTEDTDAVNVAQLKDATGNITNNVTNISDGKDGMFQVNNTSNYAKPAVTGSDSLAGGAGSSASGSNSMAVGTKASASGANSVALGNGSSATAKNSVALGANSVANRENSVSMGYTGGERQVTNVAAGTETTDAVNVGQLKQGVSESVNYTNKQFNQLKNMVNDQKDKLSAGIAGAMAMSSLPQPYAPGASMVGLGGGTYQGQSAVAFGVSTISDNGKWVTKVSGTTNSQGDFGASIGVGYQW
ncbi:autotransporter adhesin, partial [Klebsiella oxytoca]